MAMNRISTSPPLDISIVSRLNGVRRSSEIGTAWADVAGSVGEGMSA